MNENNQITWNDLRKSIWKTLNMTENTEGLTLRLLFVPNQALKMCPYGTYLLFRSLECVLRGHSVLLGSLRVTTVYVQNGVLLLWCNEDDEVSVSVLVHRVLKLVNFDKCHCIWYKTLYNPMLGSWKESKSHKNCPVMCSIVPFLFQMVLKGGHSLHMMCHLLKGLERSLNSIVYGWSWKNGFLKEVTHGDFNIVILKKVSHGDWKHYVIQCKGLERSQFLTFCCIVQSTGSWNESISM